MIRVLETEDGLVETGRFLDVAGPEFVPEPAVMHRLGIGRIALPRLNHREHCARRILDHGHPSAVADRFRRIDDLAARPGHALD